MIHITTVVRNEIGYYAQCSCGIGTATQDTYELAEQLGWAHTDTIHTYNVTVEDPNDPESTRTISMPEAEVRDTYPHWGGKPVITSREGFTVHIEAVD